MEMRLPERKLTDLTSTVSIWLGKSASTKRDLLSLIGHLAYAAKVVPLELSRNSIKDNRLELVRLQQLQPCASRTALFRRWVDGQAMPSDFTSVLLPKNLAKFATFLLSLLSNEQ